jgi:hypothetical protein
MLKVFPFPNGSTAVPPARAGTMAQFRRFFHPVIELNEAAAYDCFLA